MIDNYKIKPKKTDDWTVWAFVIAMVSIGALAGLAIPGVLIWAVIRLVLRYT